jgi:hypothetical protein
MKLETKENLAKTGFVSCVTSFAFAAMPFIHPSIHIENGTISTILFGVIVASGYGADKLNKLWSNYQKQIQAQRQEIKEIKRYGGIQLKMKFD